MTTPRLTDRAALAAHRARAAARPGGVEPLLHQLVADEVQDRLAEVNRTFTKVAVVSGQRALWRSLQPAATQVEDTVTLSLDEGAYDLVLHMLTLHWADDPVGQMVQGRLALQPDGLFLAAFFGGETLNELRGALTRAETEVLGGLSPRIAPMAEVRAAGALLQRAGFALPVADVVPLTLTYESPFHLMAELRAMGESNALIQRLRRPAPRRLFARAAEIYVDEYGDANGRVPATVEVVFLTGWAPDQGQQQPLPPGSARHRLAEALGTQEQPLIPRRDATDI